MGFETKETTTSTQDKKITRSLATHLGMPMSTLLFKSPESRSTPILL
jgi:hypothetical protein